MVAVLPFFVGGNILAVVSFLVAVALAGEVGIYNGTSKNYLDRCRWNRMHEAAGVEKSPRFRTESGLNEHLGRHENGTGPLCPRRRKTPRPSTNAEAFRSNPPSSSSRPDCRRILVGSRIQGTFKSSSTPLGECLMKQVVNSSLDEDLRINDIRAVFGTR